MIQNQSQYKNTKSSLKDLEQSLVALADNPDKVSSKILTAQQAGLQIWIDRLKSQITDYEALQQGISSLQLVSLDDLPIAIIKARISSGMTQKDLAQKIGTQEQQIQRYEANHYSAISFDRLIKVADAVGISFKHSVEISIAKRAPKAIEPLATTAQI